MNNKHIFLGLLSTMFFYGCEPEFDDTPEQSSGSLDFSKYVALGNSLTAGYRDGGVFAAGQRDAYPNLLAKQFKKVGGGEFKTPYVPEGKSLVISGGQLLTGAHRVISVAKLGEREAEIKKKGSSSISPVVSADTPAPYGTLDKISGSGPFNNLGVPGAKSYHLAAAGYGSAAGVSTGKSNPYYVRFATSDNTTVLQDAMAQHPTFFSLWIGNNDVLGFATGGGEGKDYFAENNTNPATYDPVKSGISHPSVVTGSIQKLLTELTSKGAKGVVMTIPPITAIPFFKVVPNKPIPLDEKTAAALTQGFENYNKGITQVKALGIITEAELKQRTLTFSKGQNPALIEDEDLTDIAAALDANQIKVKAALKAALKADDATVDATFNALKTLKKWRQTTDKDMFPLTTSSFLGTKNAVDNTKVNGVSAPLADKYVLTEKEAAKVGKAVVAMNDQIKALAASTAFKDKVALVDMNQVMTDINKSGVMIAGFKYTSAYISGGIFSLDGVHITGLANGYVANLVIEAINSKFGAKVPKLSEPELIALPQQFIKK